MTRKCCMLSVSAERASTMEAFGFTPTHMLFASYFCFDVFETLRIQLATKRSLLLLNEYIAERV